MHPNLRNLRDPRGPRAGIRRGVRSAGARATVALVLATALLAACSSVGDDVGEEAEDGTVEAGPGRTLAFEGPDADLLNADDLAAATFEVTATGDEPHLDDIRIQLSTPGDAEPITSQAPQTGDTSLLLEPRELEDGDYVVAVLQLSEEAVAAEDAGNADGSGDTGGTDDTGAENTDADDTGADDTGDEPAPEPDVLHEWAFELDATPPQIDITGPDGAVVAGEPVTIAGTSEPGATVEVQGTSTTVDDDGSFEVELDAVSDGTLTIVATDRAGNVSDDDLRLVTVPSRATVDQMRSVHVSFCGWASSSLKDPVMADIEAGRINAVQLDLKDETGKVGFATENEFAARIGADTPDCRIDLEAAVAELHELGVPVIGRIVAFADPVMAPWAWENGERDLAIQEPGGNTIYTGRYAGFANFANPQVQEYNIAIAEEAAAMGVDHILWDYLRKPDGSIDNMLIPGLEGSVEDEIYEFTRRADERLAPYGIQHGASLYGVSADRPGDVGQDVARLADVLDYVAPMIYPSHWGPGEYGVADPLMQPYDIITETLVVWKEATDGRRARVAPWLEDSNWPVRLGFPDRARYVREQIQATYDAGIDEWLLWDSSVRYTTDAMLAPPERESPDDSSDDGPDDSADDGDDNGDDNDPERGESDS